MHCALKQPPTKQRLQPCCPASDQQLDLDHTAEPQSPNLPVVCALQRGVSRKTSPRPLRRMWIGLLATCSHRSPQQQHMMDLRLSAAATQSDGGKINRHGSELIPHQAPQQSHSEGHPEVHNVCSSAPKPRQRKPHVCEDDARRINPSCSCLLPDVGLPIGREPQQPQYTIGHAVQDVTPARSPMDVVADT